MFFLRADLIGDSQKLLHVNHHREMSHGIDDDVDYEADDDSEVKKRVHDHSVEPLFQPTPTAAAVPLREEVGHDVTTRRTRPLGLHL